MGPTLFHIISTLPVAVAVVDRDMRYLFASDKWKADYGIHEDIIGRSHYEVFPEIIDEWKSIHQAALGGKEMHNERDPFVRANGKVQWLSWAVKPWREDNGEVGGLIMQSEDISCRVEADLELKRNLALYHQTNEVARIGSWDYHLESNKIYWSPMVRDIYEVDDEFVRNVDNLYLFFKEEDREAAKTRLERVIATGEPLDHDYEVLTATGKLKWVRIRGNAEFVDGKCERLSGTIQDIQELKIQGMELRDSEEKYKSILENSLQPHFMIDREGNILEANPAGLALFGYTLEEIKKLRRPDLMDNTDPRLEDYLKRRDDKGSAKAELTGIRKGGERFPLEISSVTFKDSRDNFRTSVSILDITERKRAEDALRLSEAEFRAAFEYSALGMSLLDIKGKWIRINESFCRILGYTNREMMLIDLFEISHPDDRERETQLRDEVLNGKKKSFQIEKRYFSKSGGIVWVHQSVSVVHDINYFPSHWTIQIQDITEQKNIENSLIEERELLRTLIDNVPLSIFIKDLQSRKKLVNKTECEYAGVSSASELLGKNDYELYPASYAAVAIAEDQEVFGSGQPIINREKVVQWRDGSTRHFLTSKIPLYDNGKISGLLGITYDITKIREAERAVFESEEKFRRIFENTQDVFYQADREGFITEISPSIEKHSEFTREEVVGKHVTQFYDDPEDRRALTEILREKRAVSDFVIRVKTKSGERRYTSLNAQFIIRNGEVIGTEGSMRDVTERKKFADSLMALNSDLNLLNEQKNKLLSVIAHDLRNSISGAVALLELVAADADDISREELLEMIGAIHRGILNAHELLEDLLEWAKLQFDSVDFHPVLIDDLAADIRQTIKKIEAAAEAKDILIQVEVPEDMSITADKHMLAAIVRNLVTNAIKFSNQGGIIEVTAVRQPGEFIFAVRDHGVGIPSDDLDKLFNGDTSYTSYGTLGEKGTGMGLGLCRSFVEKHNGRIWVESAEGKGSTFFFSIPEL